MRLVSRLAVLLLAFALGAGPAAAEPPPFRTVATAPAPAIVVAVVDSGVRADEPSLAGRVLAGWNFVAGTSDTSDDNGHGTAVAGVVASAEGASGIDAACSQCRILPVKVLDAHGVGSWDTIAAGIGWAADHGAQVINLSLGAPRVPDSVAAAVGYAISKGSIVVAAAGNDGRDESFYPASYPSVVSVTGVDGGGNRYAWSNFGARVTVAAPGCAASDFCGTSAAAPFVAGLAALALSFRPALTPETFASALAASGRSLPDGTTARSFADVNGVLAAVGVPTAPPSAERPPSLPDAALVGRPIAAVSASWHGADSLSLEWQRSRDGRSWQTVGTGSTYTPRTADRGFLLRLAVTASNVRGRTVVVSAATAPVADAVSQTKSVERRRAR